MTLYDRLNLIGTRLTKQQREDAAKIAKVLRKWAGTTFKRSGKGKGRYVVKPYDDELGALADQLDTLAGPIVVQR